MTLDEALARLAALEREVARLREERDAAQMRMEEIENKFFVAGQMDAQGSAAEKWKTGSGGPVLALSRRLLGEARAALQQAVGKLT